MSDVAKDAVERRTDDAFVRSSWQDPRAEYRAVLRHLREHDSETFERAVREYDACVLERLTDEDVDPVRAWLDYGLLLAALVGRGRTVRIDALGGAGGVSDAGGEPALLLHLPAEESAGAFVVAAPRQPSPAQNATIALLAAGATALAR